MAKVQDKHEKQLNELINENRHQMEKIHFYDEKTKEFSSQIHSLNEEKLMLLKEHEIMKSKLRTYEIDSTLNRGNAVNGASKYYDKIKGKLIKTLQLTIIVTDFRTFCVILLNIVVGNFRMEDEEGELFDNTYLEELKGGRGGRESLTLDEIHRRNSMQPPHLRSSYMPQFTDTDQKVNQSILTFCRSAH